MTTAHLFMDRTCSRCKKRREIAGGAVMFRGKVFLCAACYKQYKEKKSDGHQKTA